MWVCFNQNCHTLDAFAPSAERRMIMARLIDADRTIEIVRCRDCKHYKPQKKSEHWENRANYCDLIAWIKVQPNDFCSYGERKDGDDNG